jgi:hypothetical protein
MPADNPRNILWKSSTLSAAILTIGFLVCAPAFAQTKPDTATSSAPSGQTKDTQGLSAGTTPPESGSDAEKQKTFGAGVGTQPDTFGSDAEKQKTVGAGPGAPDTFGSAAAKR